MKRQTFRKFLSLLLALVMTISLLPLSALAVDEPQDGGGISDPAGGPQPLGSPVTVNVTILAQAYNAFLCAPQTAAVSSDLAERYGYTDEVEGGVSTLDVLVKAHELVYGADFTPDTCQGYLEVSSSGFATNVFGLGSAFSYTVNGKAPHDDVLVPGSPDSYTGYTIAQASVSEGDTVEFLFYQDAYYLDNYVWFTQDGARKDVLTGEEGASLTLALEGYCLCYYGCATDEFIASQTTPIEEAQLAFVDLSSGALTDIEGAVTDESGEVTLTLPQSAGTYTLTAYIPPEKIEDYTVMAPCFLPLQTVEVTAPQMPWEGEGTEESPYLLADAADFDALDAMVSEGELFAGVSFLMTGDVTLTDGWNGLGDSSDSFLPFAGTLDGGGYTVTIPKGAQPLFDCVRQSTIENLKIYGEYIADDGLVANYTVDSGEGGSIPATADIQNVTILSGTRIAGSGFLGGYASGSNTVNILNCTVESGVIVGCDESGNSLGASNIGGFAGDFNGTVQNSRCAATVYGENFVGGIIGGKGQSLGLCSVTGCVFSGSVVATGNYVGGIAGSGYTGTRWGFTSNAGCISVQNCLVTGSVQGGDYVGGIQGAEPGVVQCWDNGVGSVTDNLFCGTLISSGSYTGGIIGFMKSLNRNNVTQNNYYLDSAAARGIGGAEYVDTSDADHETESGAVYFDTSAGASGVGGASKKNLNRTDDPLGKDQDALAAGVSERELRDGTVTDLLNGSSTSLKNWVQGASYPVFDGSAPTALSLTVSGSYKETYEIGEALDLSGAAFTVAFSDGTETHPTLSELQVSEFDSATAGEKEVTLSYRGVSTTLTLTVRPAVETIEVTFSLLGDDAHGAPTEESGTHTMAGGGLQTWIPETTYEVASDATVKDVFEMALTDAGMTWVNSTGTYIESITNGSTTLGEMTNGASSGWLFLLNGAYGLLGMDQQTLQNGDKITFHYTDDYNVEFGGGGEAPDDKPEEPTVDPDLEALRSAAGSYLASAVTNPTIASTGGDWAVFGLARAGYSVNEGYYATYYGNVAAALKAANGVLHNYKYTEYSRVILGLTAAGYDPRDVGGYNLLAPLADYDKVVYQGANGAAYALLALDSHGYAIPTAPAGKTQTTRENLVSYLLSKELPSGGWALSGDAADADLTAIVLQALAPCQSSNSAAAAAIDRGLAALSDMQKASGGFESNGAETCESSAQVLVALTALGIDPATDARFLQGENSVLTALASYALSGGAFSHLSGGAADGMATEQAYYALTAYYRFETGADALYDMTAVTLASGGTPTTHTHTYQDGTCTICGALDPNFKPVITKGAGGVFTKGGKDGLSFTSNAAFADFRKVQVDGKELDSANYTVKKGSTIVTLKASYLETLSVGTHTLAIVSSTGTAETTFTVKAAGTTTGGGPATGDGAQLFLYGALLLTSAGAAAFLLRKKREEA